MLARPLVLLAAAALVTGVAVTTLDDGGDGGDGGGRPVPMDGATLFRAKGCATCHTGPGATSSSFGIGPDLRDAATWAGSRLPDTPAEDYVRQSIVDPRAFISPAAVDAQFVMPALPLAPEELDLLVAHLLEPLG